jgi:hypothetical protein
MWHLLFWLYLINATVLATHEVESGYWKEWELFHLPGGLAGFLWMHIPLFFAVLWGVAAIDRRQPAGAVIALALGVGCLAGFGLHTFFIRRGHPAFTTAVSGLLLKAMGGGALLQVALSAYLLVF